MKDVELIDLRMRDLQYQRFIQCRTIEAAPQPESRSAGTQIGHIKLRWNEAVRAESFFGGKCALWIFKYADGPADRPGSFQKFPGIDGRCLHGERSKSEKKEF